MLNKYFQVYEIMKSILNKVMLNKKKSMSLEVINGYGLAATHSPDWTTVLIYNYGNCESIFGINGTIDSESDSLKSVNINEDDNKWSVYDIKNCTEIILKDEVVNLSTTINLKDGFNDGEIFQLSTLYSDEIVNMVSLVSHYRNNNEDLINGISYKKSDVDIDCLIKNLQKIDEVLYAQ